MTVNKDFVMTYSVDPNKFLHIIKVEKFLRPSQDMQDVCAVAKEGTWSLKKFTN